jgi:hypothetical protein
MKSRAVRELEANQYHFIRKYGRKIQNFSKLNRIFDNLEEGISVLEGTHEKIIIKSCKGIQTRQKGMQIKMEFRIITFFMLTEYQEWNRIKMR